MAPFGSLALVIRGCRIEWGGVEVTSFSPLHLEFKLDSSSTVTISTPKQEGVVCGKAGVYLVNVSGNNVLDNMTTSSRQRMCTEACHECIASGLVADKRASRRAWFNLFSHSAANYALTNPHPSFCGGEVLAKIVICKL
jgi:hypothetical protein